MKAIVIEKTEGGSKAALTDFDEANLMEGDVTVRVEYSTINYKDGLAITGKAPVVRRWPMIGGVDLAGTVETSTNPKWKPGDKVVLNGFGLGETHLGAFAEKVRVKGDWLVRLPSGISTRDAMAIGTAGYTAMLLGAGIGAARRDAARRGPAIVTGARRRRRLGRRRAALQTRLPRHCLDRPYFRSRLSEIPRRRRNHRPRGAFRPGETARERALGRGHRQRRLDDARQCSLHDEIRRRDRRLRPRAGDGSALLRRALHPARHLAARHRFGDVPGWNGGNRHGSALPPISTATS